jgi:imidazole glycerol-phosphate synthase subunit HisH
MPRPPAIAVVDTGAGNLRSVTRALARAGLAPEVTAAPEDVRRADGVVLPGVGNFATAAANLRAKGLDEALREVLAEGRPYLGICLGLQLLFEESDEHGRCAGLGVLPGRVERFPERDACGRTLRVPHIGWNQVRFSGSHPMLAGLPREDCYYFVHAYCARPAGSDCVVGRTEYGDAFASAVAAERIFAVQFHPEKSQRAGFVLLEAYARWIASCD